MHIATKTNINPRYAKRHAKKGPPTKLASQITGMYGLSNFNSAPQVGQRKLGSQLKLLGGMIAPRAEHGCEYRDKTIRTLSPY
jgi:hypothetical protein